MNRQQAFELLDSLKFDNVKNQADLLPKQGLQNYLTMHLDRFLLTVDLVKKYAKQKDAPAILDVGSFPYFLPVLLTEEMDAKVVGVDLPQEAYWPGTPYEKTEQKVELVAGETKYAFTHHLLNIEQDDLPYQDKFDAVLFTEVLEHLLLQPHKVIERIHRSLKKDGIIIITTPNAKYLMKLLAAIKGSNINEKYNLTLGAYGRHNREYLLEEVTELLNEHNFTILDAELLNFPKRHLSAAGQAKYKLIESLTHLPGGTGRKEGIVVVARKKGSTVSKEPDSLFRR